MVNLKHKTHLFFDLDDTLWDFEKNSSLVLRDLFVEFELDQKLNTDFDGFYAAYKKINHHLWSLYYTKQIDKAYLRNHRFNEAFKLFNYDNYSENLVLTDHYLERSPKGKLLKEGCVDILNYLKPKYHLHIITNGFKEVQDVKMKGSGITHYFKNIIVSEEHALTKPDEKIFRLAEGFANTQKEECVMIGDNYDSDIVGALNAGWEAIYFSENNEINYEGHLIKQLHDLKKMF